MSESGDDEQDFAAGEVVHDRDDDDPNDAVVVNVPPIPASEWDVHPLDKTLAEANPDYPADAQTVIVVFEEALTEYFETTDIAGELESQIPIATLADEHVQFYAFPAPRLEATGERYIHNSEAEAELTDGERVTSDGAAAGSADSDSASTTETTSEDGSDAAAFDALAERLASSGMRVVDRDEEMGTLTIEKMRDTYRVKPGQVVEGDGRFRSRLEQLVGDDDANEG